MSQRYSSNDNVDHKVRSAQQNVGRGDVPTWLLLHAKAVAAYFTFAGVSALASYLFHTDFYQILAGLALFIAVVALVKHS